MLLSDLVLKVTISFFDLDGFGTFLAFLTAKKLTDVQAKQSNYKQKSILTAAVNFACFLSR